MSGTLRGPLTKTSGRPLEASPFSQEGVKSRGQPPSAIEENRFLAALQNDVPLERA